jgi:hypothetical protein
VPYSNVERRRQFQREYKRKWRAKQAKIQPMAAFRIYFCQRYPTLHISGAGTFFNSFLISNDREAQRMIEAHDLFGVHIFCLALNLDLISDDEKIN